MLGNKLIEFIKSPKLRRIGIASGIITLCLILIVLGTFLWAFNATDRSLLARGLIWGDADVNDWQRFSLRNVEKSLNPIKFSITNQNQLTMALDKLKVEDKILFNDFLRNSNTTAFIIIHEDELIYEKYFNGGSRESTQSSFSIAKSFLSTLVGIAISEGYVGGLDDPVTEYIPELLERDEKFAKITLRHLITMTSGIKFERTWSPWSDNSKTYYSPDLRTTALSAEIIEEPGIRFQYNDYNPLLIGIVVERATSMTVTEYLESRLWQPMGAEGNGSWSIDSETSGFEKMNTGINGRAIDLAKLGWLFLNQGQNGSNQVVPRDWVEEATRRDSTTDPAPYYQYYWWVDEAANAYWAEGNFGQNIYVYPDANLVLVRMGDKAKNEKDISVNWTEFSRSVARWLEQHLQEDYNN